MDYDPEFSRKPGAELNACLVKYAEEHEYHARALSELTRRERAAADGLSRAVFWSRLAALLALPGALFVVWRIIQFIHGLAAAPSGG